MVDFCIRRVLGNLFVDIFQFNCKMFYIQQLSFFHGFLHINVVTFKKFFIIVYTLCKYTGSSILPGPIYSQTSDKQASILDKRDRKAHINHSNFLQFSWLADLYSLFAKWNAFIIKFNQIYYNEDIFDVAMYCPSRLQLQNSSCQFQGQGAILICLNIFPSVIQLPTNLEQLQGLVISPFHLQVLVSQLNFQLKLFGELFQGDAFIDEQLAFSDELIQAFFIEQMTQPITSFFLRKLQKLYVLIGLHKMINNIFKKSVSFLKVKISHKRISLYKIYVGMITLKIKMKNQESTINCQKQCLIFAIIVCFIQIERIPSKLFEFQGNYCFYEVYMEPFYNEYQIFYQCRIINNTNLNNQIKMDHLAKESTFISTKMVVLSMINGMIGGLILLLPILALKTGYALSIIVIVTAGFFSYYSCCLCLLHLGDQPDLDSAIFKHFNRSQKIRNFYDLSIFVNLVLICILYFQLITIQWVGLAPPYYFTNLNPIINAFLLLFITIFMKYYSFGAKLMAYGIISIIVYLIFLMWVFADQSIPETKRQFPAFGQNGIQLFASMGMGFSIQGFFIPILKKYKDTNNYNKLLKVTYSIGGSIYMFITLVGSYGILYRNSMGYNEGVMTIEQYFGTGTWQVNIIQVIYLIHLYSVFPQFLLISKKRLFNVLKIQESQSKTINYKEITYVSCFIIICVVISILRISMRELIDINGAFLGFVFIYLIPSFLHIKCMYFSKGKVPLGSLIKKGRSIEKYEIMIEEGNMGLQTQYKKQSGQQIKEKAVETKFNEGKLQNQAEANQQVEINKKFQLQPGDIKQSAVQNIFQNQSAYECSCDKKDYTMRQKIADGAIVGCMFLVGFYILMDTLVQLI